MTAKTPRLRFAPSPTGPLHIGGARTALYNYVAAKALSGRFILRIEDTDQERSTATSLHHILEGLRWLGLEWDEGPEKGGDHGPYFQMQRLPIYAARASELVANGHAYPCYCTPEEVEQGRQRMQAASGHSIYDRRCRDLTAAERRAREASGIRPSLRFRMPLAEDVTVHDLCRGTVTVNTRELDDWVMVRPDGVPLYNFACVVDDLEMEITHVVRGEEHFLNGIKQILQFRAHGATPPAYAHIPLILGKDGKKLSKRDAATALLDYRDKGFPRDAVFNYIALLGWGFSGERDLFTPQEMIGAFRIEDIGKAGARFDEEKLLWMSGDYIRRMRRAELVAAVQPFVVRAQALPAAAFASHPHWVENVIACCQERIRLFSEAPAWCSYHAQDRVEPDAAAQKNLAKLPGAAAMLAAYADAVQGLALPPSYPRARGDADQAVQLPSRKDAPEPATTWATPKQLEQHAREFVAGAGLKFGDFVHPVRAALTGTTAGPGLFDVMFLLGRERVLARLRPA